MSVHNDSTDPSDLVLGVTPELCIFHRTTSYGNTLAIGTNASHAGSIRIEVPVGGEVNCMRPLCGWY